MALFLHNNVASIHLDTTVQRQVKLQRIGQGAWTQWKFSLLGYALSQFEAVRCKTERIVWGVYRVHDALYIPFW